MSPLVSPPSSLGLRDEEAQFRHSDLDLAYIDGLGADLGRLLRLRKPVEVNYQPGDMTRYPLIFLPLAGIASARPRIVDGVEWDRHAVDGMRRSALDAYGPEAFLVSYIDRAAVPLWLGNRAHDGIAAGYVETKFGVPPVSAVSLATLFRSASWWIDYLSPGPRR